MKKLLKRLARVTALLVLILVVVVAAGVVWPDPALPASPAVTPLLAITNVSVVDIEHGELVDGAKTVLVRDGRIVTIAAADSVDVAAEARRIDGTGRFLAEMVEQHDPAMCEAVFQAFVEHDTWFTPTHITRRWEGMYHDPVYRADKRLRQVPLVHRLVWSVDAFFIDMAASEPSGREALKRFYEAGLGITGQAHRRGVKILAGTDALDAHAFYGSGLHDELSELVKAGLTPGEALQTATLNPARFLGMEESQGSVNAGKWAELVLLDANPLENIHNVRRIEAVVARDRIYERRHLADLVTSVEALAGRWQTSCKLLWGLIRFTFTG